MCAKCLKEGMFLPASAKRLKKVKDSPRAQVASSEREGEGAETGAAPFGKIMLVVSVLSFIVSTLRWRRP